MCLFPLYMVSVISYWEITSNTLMTKSRTTPLKGVCQNTHIFVFYIKLMAAGVTFSHQSASIILQCLMLWHDSLALVLKKLLILLLKFEITIEGCSSSQMEWLIVPRNNLNHSNWNRPWTLYDDNNQVCIIAYFLKDIQIYVYCCLVNTN
jgi:hypothetical protein